MSKLKIAINPTPRGPGQSGQLSHRVTIGDEVLGTLYDNHDCPQQSHIYVFNPVGAARIAGRYLVYDADIKDYLHRAPGVRGNDLVEVERMINTWAESVKMWITERRQELRAVLDELPEADYRLSKIGKQYPGLTCQVLNHPVGSFTMRLGWSNMAKLLSTDDTGYQITDAGSRDRDWGTEWYAYSHAPDVIHWGTYSKDTMMSVTRPAPLPDFVNVARASS
jgi:hypothetical protein